MIDYTLYLCTDRDIMSTETLEEAVNQAIEGGVTLVQLREKDCSSAVFYENAMKLKKVTDRYKIPLIINDRVDIAMAVDAAGVHIGQSDIPAAVVREIIGSGKIMGVSTATVKEAVKAQKDGADYIGVGAMFATGTKKNTRSVTTEQLADIRDAVTIPIVVIGGINETNVAQLKGKNIDGLAVISAIIGKQNIQQAAADLKKLFTE